VIVLFLLHPAYGLFALFCVGFLFLLSLLTDLSTREDLVRANGETAKALNDLSAALRHTELLDGMECCQPSRGAGAGGKKARWTGLSIPRAATKR